MKDWWIRFCRSQTLNSYLLFYRSMLMAVLHLFVFLTLMAITVTIFWLVSRLFFI